MTFPEPLRSFWYAALALERGFRMTPWGAVVADPRFPRVHEANLASVLEPRPGLTVREIRADLRPALAASSAIDEHIEFMDGDEPCPAIDELRSETGDHDAHVAMVFEGRPADLPHPSGGVDVHEIPEPDDSFWATYRLVPNEFGRPLPDDVLDQMLDRVRRVFLPAGLRFFVGRLGGAFAGVTSVLTLEGVAYVDNVVTVPRYRRQGVAGATLGTAVRAALAGGAATTFLLAEEDGAARRLYERMGFRARCRCIGFTAPLGGGPVARPAQPQVG